MIWKVLLQFSVINNLSKTFSFAFVDTILVYGKTLSTMVMEYFAVDMIFYYFNSINRWRILYYAYNITSKTAKKLTYILTIASYFEEILSFHVMSTKEILSSSITVWYLYKKILSKAKKLNISWFQFIHTLSCLCSCSRFYFCISYFCNDHVLCGG